MTPRLSVVVAAWTGAAELQRCLDALRTDTDPAHDELIVAHNFSASPADPAISVPCAATTTVPALRAAGLAVSRGDVVAFIEDHCVVAPGWRRALLAAHEPGVAAVGGPVAAASDARPLDDAVYLYDYARFAPPLQDGVVRSLSGANMSFSRQVLDASQSLLSDGVLEVELEAECNRRGLVMRIAGSAVVTHDARHLPGASFRLAFDLARGYAARRGDQAGALRRACLAVATPALPILLGWRIGRRMSARWEFGRLAASLPWLAGLLIAWAAGEGAGYAAGAGKSAKRWR